MRSIPVAMVCLLLLTATPVSAAPAAPGLLRASSNVALVQDQPKENETLKQKVKRAWKNLVGYRFAVSCPALPFTTNRTTCTETGKNREDARAKCQAKHTFCEVTQARR